MNIVILRGHLVRDPELRYTPAGAAICDFTIANNKVWTTKEGEKKEQVNFVGCLCWGRRGEVISEYFKKGKEILIRGELQYQNWETKEGEKRSIIKVNVDNFEFIGAKAGEVNSVNGGRAVGDATDADKPSFPAPRPEVNEEEIPF